MCRSTEETVETPLKTPSLLERYTCASALAAILAIFGKLTFVPYSEHPGYGVTMHSWRVPAALTVGYLVSLPVMKSLTNKYLLGKVDVKALLKETMILYNVAQVILNGWTVYKILDALLNRGHPLIGDLETLGTGASYAVWVHYCDKYLEFFDTYFMVLRGNFKQVRTDAINAELLVLMLLYLGMTWSYRTVNN